MTRSAFVLGLFLALSGLALAGDTYPIQLKRTYKKGYKFTVGGSAVASEVQKQTARGTPQVNKTYGSMMLEGEVEVLDVDAGGMVTKATCVVHHCEWTNEEGAEWKEAFAEGTVLTQELKDSELVVTSDSGAVAPELVSLLNEFLPCEKKDEGPSIDEMLGTRESRKVGDRWEIDAAKFAAGLSKDTGMQVEAAQVSGSVTLVEVGEEKGVNCMAIHAEVKVTNLVPPPLQGAAVKSAVLNLTMDVVLPVDAALPVVGDRGKMEYHVEATVKDPAAGDVVVEDTVHNEKEVEFTPAE